MKRKTVEVCVGIFSGKYVNEVKEEIRIIIKIYTLKCITRTTNSTVNIIQLFWHMFGRYHIKFFVAATTSNSIMAH